MISKDKKSSLIVVQFAFIVQITIFLRAICLGSLNGKKTKPLGRVNKMPPPLLLSEEIATENSLFGTLTFKKIIK